ncbi:DUF4199 domain-containing protein [Ichthyenterobacterium magnum]|uniref:Uncharacterized protein DUF4199 n=1 Tax=Ichthyenterobacterium magnum TaxID=1230530 RepID=A0A420DWN1_9FLAO|nr:DUF4199 domain-containing protein [Ichthyenterobacterium magnum]RKE98627.1 uncharacterized protein DUF4199 [Ichthyenterobacterium magnum]
MKNTIIKYGSYGLLVAIILFLLVLWLGQGMSYTTQEVFGYITMLASLSFIFFGIKHYRDHVNQGILSFGNGFVIGLLIAVFVGLGIGIADYIYTTIINPDFATEYLDKTLSTMKETMSTEEFEKQKDILVKQMDDYGGSGFMAFIMFITVVMIGLIISLISSLILQQKK